MHKLAPAFACLTLLAALAAACSSPTAAPAEPRSAAASLSPDETSEAAAAARAGLRRYLDLVPEAQRAGYGFASREEMDRAQVAAVPYRVWTADPARLLAGGGPETFSAVREWRFAVTVDGEPRALLTVAAVRGALQAVDFGATGLAGELGRLEKERGVPADARRVLLRIHELRADFAAWPGPSQKVEEAGFEPLASARQLPQVPASALDGPRLAPWLRERLRAARPE